MAIYCIYNLESFQVMGLHALLRLVVRLEKQQLEAISVSNVVLARYLIQLIPQYVQPVLHLVPLRIRLEQLV